MWPNSRFWSHKLDSEIQPLWLISLEKLSRLDYKNRSLRRTRPQRPLRTGTRKLLVIITIGDGCNASWAEEIEPEHGPHRTELKQIRVIRTERGNLYFQRKNETRTRWT